MCTMKTLLDNIQTWLQEQADYDTGLALLEQTGFSGFVLNVLKKGADAYTRRRLATELTTWLNSRSEPVSPPAEPINVGTLPDPVRVYPAAIRELQQTAYSLMDERAELKAQLRALMTDPGAQPVRRDAAFRILAIGKQLDSLYAQIDFFEQYGYLAPSQEPEADQDDHARLMSVRTYVSRYRTKLKKPGLTPTQRQEAEKLLKDYEDEKKLLERKLAKS